LIKILESTNDSKIKLAILSILFYRIKDQADIELDIKVIPYTVSQHYKIPPGTMCIYLGNLNPLCYSNTDIN